VSKARIKLVINCIFLVLIVPLVYKLGIAVEWIADRVPDGIVGLLIVLGYLLLIGILSIVLIIKFANEALIAEQEIKQYKLKSPANKFHLFKKKK